MSLDTAIRIIIFIGHQNNDKYRHSNIIIIIIIIALIVQF